MRRTGALALLLLLAAGFLAGLAPAAGALPAQLGQEPSERSANDGLDDLAGCVRGSRQLLVLLAIDESQSLRDTDKRRQRVAAAVSALDSLATLTSSAVPADQRPTVQVAIAGFSDVFAPTTDWTGLDASTLPALERSARAFGRRDDGRETDLVNAVAGAREELARESAAVTGQGGAVPCKALLLFTDGRYELAKRTASNDGEVEATKSYAPGQDLRTAESVAAAVRAGRDELCRAGGLADGLRSDGTTIVTVALADKIDASAQELLGALSTGRSGATRCGTPSDRVPGAFLPVTGIDALLLRFDEVANRIAGGTLVRGTAEVPACVGEPCDEGRRSFVVDDSLRQVHVLALAPTAGARVVVTDPSGRDSVLDPNTRRVGGASAKVRQVNDRAVAVDLRPPADRSGWAGTWSVSVVVERPTSARAAIQVLTFTNIVATLDPGVFGLGAESLLVARVSSADAPLKAGQRSPVARAAVVAQISDPLSSFQQDVAMIGTPGDPGVLAARFTAPKTLTSSYLRVSLKLDAVTTGGVAVSSTSSAVNRTVKRPDGYPNLAPALLDLPSVTGDGSASGELLVIGASKQAGCVWFDPPTLRGVPDGAAPVAVTAGDGSATSRSSCLHVAANATERIEVRVSPSGRSSGSVQGAVRAWVVPDKGGAPIRTDIPFRFDTTRGIDEAKRILLAIVLLVGGLLVPLVLLGGVNAATTRFQDVDAVRGAVLPVVVRRAGVLRVRPDGEARALGFADDDFRSLADAGSNRRFRFGGIEFRARPPLNPFAEGSARAVPEGVADRSEGSRVDLDLALAGSWIFLLDPDATAAAPEGEQRGSVIAFVAEGDLAPQARRLVPDLLERLPGTARRMAEVAAEGRQRLKRSAKRARDAAPEADDAERTDADGVDEPGLVVEPEAPVVDDARD